jgi:hypothetical protein
MKASKQALDSRKRNDAAPRNNRRTGGLQAKQDLSVAAKELTDQHVNAQLELADRIQKLLEKSAPQPEPTVFKITVEDGKAITACSRGNERAVLEWLFDGLRPVLAPFGQEGISSLEAARSALLSSEPRSPIEALLISQMLASHQLAMQFGARAVRASDSAVAGRLAERARGFMEVACRQMETLMKLRGDTVQQRLAVQHTYVQDGGQAVVRPQFNQSSGGHPLKIENEPHESM